MYWIVYTVQELDEDLFTPIRSSPQSGLPLPPWMQIYDGGFTAAAGLTLYTSDALGWPTLGDAHAQSQQAGMCEGWRVALFSGSCAPCHSHMALNKQCMHCAHAHT